MPPSTHLQGEVLPGGVDEGLAVVGVQVEQEVVWGEAGGPKNQLVCCVPPSSCIPNPCGTTGTGMATLEADEVEGMPGFATNDAHAGFQLQQLLERGGGGKQTRGGRQRRHRDPFPA